MCRQAGNLPDRFLLDPLAGHYLLCQPAGIMEKEAIWPAVMVSSYLLGRNLFSFPLLSCHPAQRKKRRRQARHAKDEEREEAKKVKKEKTMWTWPLLFPHPMACGPDLFHDDRAILFTVSPVMS